MSVAEKLLQLKTDMDSLFEKGKEAARQAFADAYQEEGNLINYYQRFSQSGWNDGTFSYIRYPIVCAGGGTNANNVFTRCQITKISVPVVIEETAAQETFYYATKLEEIDSLTLVKVPSLLRIFSGCSKLRHIGFQGSIDVDLSISAAPELDEETRQSIVDCLKDLTGLEKQTLTLHKTVGEKLTGKQKADIAAKNWELKY